MKLPSIFQTPHASKDSFRLPRWLEVLFAIVIFLELFAPFVTTTLGLDGRLHLKMMAEFGKLLYSGVSIPTWTPDGFYHFGATSFYFYPPITFYLSSIVSVVGIQDPLSLFQAVSLLGTIASFFSARWLLRTIGSSEYRSNIAAALYACAPLRVAELYSRSSLPTHVTYTFIPLVAIALIAIVRREGTSRIKRILLLGLWCAILALTNVPITVMMAMAMIVAAIVVWRELRWNAVIDIMLAGAIAAGLAAYHYASVLSAQPFSRLQDLHFSHRPQDIELYFHLGPGTYHILVLYAAVGIIVLAYTWLRWKKESLTRIESAVGRIGLSIAAIIFFLDLFPISAGVWNAFPPLQLVQFPWRFYPLDLLLGIMVIGSAQSLTLKRAAKLIAAVWIVGAVLPIILVVFSFHIFSPFVRAPEDPTEYLPIYFNPSVSPENGGMRGAVERTLRPHASDSAVLGNLQMGEKVEGVVREPYHEKYDVTLKTPRPVTFHRFYWPFWHLYASGNEVYSRPDSIGRATATFPSGHYTAVWQLERTPLEIAGLWISGISWVGVLVFLGIGLVRRRVRAMPSSSP